MLCYLLNQRQCCVFRVIQNMRNLQNFSPLLLFHMNGMNYFVCIALAHYWVRCFITTPLILVIELIAVGH